MNLATPKGDVFKTLDFNRIRTPPNPPPFRRGEGGHFSPHPSPSKCKKKTQNDVIKNAQIVFGLIFVHCLFSPPKPCDLSHAMFGPRCVFQHRVAGHGFHLDQRHGRDVQDQKGPRGGCQFAQFPPQVFRRGLYRTERDAYVSIPTWNPGEGALLACGV